MTLRFSVTGTVLLAGCIGGSMSQTASVGSASPAPDAFACARDQIKAVSFTQTSFDTDALRINARKYNEGARRSNVSFRRLVDRLEVEVSPGSGGEVSRITVVAMTFAELTTQRGPTEEQERTSEQARAAAQTILDKCGGQRVPAVTDSLVPPS